ncbi:MAG TPA: ABC transporter ATP-binding protein [Synergistaceae bacterium]|nr:ABC transporter ATP-binding protein [Synergistaceae bacterium]HQF91542.1 ABC transporter ATP-binding protein [Synergistaceae bacterium]HQH77419.1 ABC transporter ATP-binding protein [Synergistaceae bacterium]HQK24911.1 ABC transporter ATP-binding protein [Synergistaceae bacterium]
MAPGNAPDRVPGSPPLLEVRDLRVNFATYGGTVQAVRGLSFSMEAGECLALVGESGCGKSVTAQSLLRLVPHPPATTTGSVRFDGRELLDLSEREMNRLRGAAFGMVFQDPMTSLNPTMPVGRQIEEALREHERLSRSAARERVLDMLRLVGMPEPERRYGQYPHECSGGMRQRVLIAMALVCGPRLIVADEPTTALDVTIQAQILDILKNLQSRLGTALLLITHDLGVVAHMAHRIAVVYAGRIVETAPVRELFARPSHPYTRRLLCSRPSLDGEAARGPLCAIKGTPPDLFAPPPGCGFAPRCDYAMALCGTTPPPALGVGTGHRSSCWLLHPQARERYGDLMRAPLERR